MMNAEMELNGDRIGWPKMYFPLHCKPPKVGKTQK